jgi:hypothetical protein
MGIEESVISILVRRYRKVKIVGKIVHIEIEQNRAKNGTLWNSKTDIGSTEHRVIDSHKLASSSEVACNPLEVIFGESLR